MRSFFVYLKLESGPLKGTGEMKRKRLSEESMIGILKEAEARARSQATDLAPLLTGRLAPLLTARRSPARLQISHGVQHQSLPLSVASPMAPRCSGDIAVILPTRPAAFLDRDGVINVDTGYPHRPEDLRLTPSAADGIRLLNLSGYWVIVVTNQSGVARGLFGVAEVEAFHGHIAARLSQQGAAIDAYYFCPYHPHATVAQWRADHEDRKPRPGMLLRALREWPIAREGSFLIGDKPSDVAAAEAAGIPGVLVPTDTVDLAAVVRDQLAGRLASAAPLA